MISGAILEDGPALPKFFKRIHTTQLRHEVNANAAGFQNAAFKVDGVSAAQKCQFKIGHVGLACFKFSKRGSKAFQVFCVGEED